jgi:hypothetical protein
MKKANKYQVLKPYMGYERDAIEEGACLIFAHDCKEAKALAHGCLSDWFNDHEYIHTRVHLIKEHIDYIYRSADQKELAAGIAHVIDNPDTCPNCEYWGGVAVVDGVCEYCKDDE